MKNIKKYTITNMDRLKAMKANQRKVCHSVKPIVTQDRKKEANKRACRDWKD